MIFYTSEQIGMSGKYLSGNRAGIKRERAGQVADAAEKVLPTEGSDTTQPRPIRKKCTGKEDLTILLTD